jgi:hypothetical protein
MARARSGKAVCAQDSKKGVSDVPLLILNIENPERHPLRRRVDGVRLVRCGRTGVAATPAICFHNRPNAAHFSFGQKDGRVQTAQASFACSSGFCFEK